MRFFCLDRRGSSLPINLYFFVLLMENLAQPVVSGLENRCTGNLTVGSNPTLSDLYCLCVRVCWWFIFPTYHLTSPNVFDSVQGSPPSESSLLVLE